MPQLTPEQFAKAVVSAALATADDLKKLWAGLKSGTRPKTSDDFAQLLVEQNVLTEFQAQSLLTGSSLPLVLGDYVLLGKIGAGGMGQVYKAQHRHMKRLVAIKLLSEALTKDEGAVKRFQREVEAAAKLSHPHIMHAHDASVQRGVWYLVMEYVAGSDLASLVRNEGPLSASRAVRCVRQAAEGLAYAHRQGVIHRDIKPGNLLLGANDEVKILDMGLARLDASLPRQDDLTGTGQIMGTIDYMAPEQAANTKHADARADIYSLGMTLWFLMTGRAAYDGDTVIEKLLAHREQPIPSLAAVCPGVNNELDQVFRRMIAKKAEDRFQTMPEVIAALDACPPPSELELTTNMPASAPAVGNVRGNKSGPAVLTAPTLKQAVTEVPDTIASGFATHDTNPSAQLKISAINVSTNQKTPPTAWLDWRVLTGAALVAVIAASAGIYVAVNREDPNRREASNSTKQPTQGTEQQSKPVELPDNTAQQQPTEGTALKLTAADVEAGSIEGPWRFEYGGLTSPQLPFAQFRLPGKPASRYLWKFDLTREAGTGPLIVGLPVGKAVVIATLDDGPSHKCEWGERTQAQVSRSTTTTEFAGFTGKTVRVECRVSESQLRVNVNAIEVLRHTGPATGISTPARWQLADYGRGFLATPLTKFRFENIEFHDWTGE